MKQWKKVISACLLAAGILMTGQAAYAQAGKEAPPVILDTDMVDWLDDGAAMLMLAKSPRTDLIGVTVVLGNTWVETGTASAIRQLEAIGSKDIPVYMGVNEPIRKDRFKTIADEPKKFGRGKDSHNGAAGYPEPASWQAEYRTRYGAEPQLAPEKESAPDFIIKTVKARPNEVTIVAIGSGANLAAAVKKDPSIAPLVKRVIYMGGNFFQQGNVMPYAEFNVWIDPEAEKTAFRAPFGEQVIVPLDACEKIHITRDRYFSIKEMMKNPVMKDLLKKHWMTPFFEENKPLADNYVWDVLSAAIAIDPSVITEEVTYPVDVIDQYGPAYGTTMAYKGVGPEGTQKARIILSVDENKIWNMLYTLCRSL
jgi:inosine-uridine nucleoside N-ribohydrolase